MVPLSLESAVQVGLGLLKHTRNKQDMHHLLPGGCCNNPDI
jgi:hypothetical protein